VSIKLYNEDNITICRNLSRAFNFIYADCIYNNVDLDWLSYVIDLLLPNAILIIQTDYHTVANYKSELDKHLKFINWIIYINDWGGTPKNKFAQKHDDILIYCNGDKWKWYPERIQIAKKTAGTKFDKKGTGLKTPPSVFYDHVSFSTISKERIKFNNKNIQWQKPEWLLERLLLPFTNKDDNVLDPFMGSGTLGLLCKKYGRNYVGIESNKDIFNIAEKRISNDN